MIAKVVFGLVAMCLLGGSVSMGVMAERASRAGSPRVKIQAVIVSIFCGIGALYCAYLIGTMSALPR